MKGSPEPELWPRLRRGVADLTARSGGGAPAVIDGSYGKGSSARSYRLYPPAWFYIGRRPLVVMLHGCHQDPTDFAAGTRMHARGKGRGCFVLYPGQDRVANRMGCWNWFEAVHQQRATGEPAILAALTRDIIARYRVDPNRVYVAGLSAGGAMAATLATTHPELFAAAAIHSGLPHGAATNAVSALLAMKRGPSRRRGARGGERGGAVPTIVFHGDQDDTVHPGNGEELIARLRSTPPGAESPATPPRTIRGKVPGGRAYTRTVHHDAKGRIEAEHWVIHGSGHAWSGGAPAGSYTDPLGPDASVEMLRFFSEHPRRWRSSRPASGR